MRALAARAALTAALLAGAPARADVQVVFVPASPAEAHHADAYRAIWQAYGARIVAALEARTCLPFAESTMAALVAEDVSHSGGPEHPMQLRASYGWDAKKSTLVHELGHRLLWQLERRLDGIDGHHTLFLVLDRVWADVWGEPFAEARVLRESGWEASYDYAAAWDWARSLSAAERADLWSSLLALNGLWSDCAAALDDADEVRPVDARSPSAPPPG